MGEQYRFFRGHAQISTFAVVGGVDVFTRREHAELDPENLAY